MQSLNHLSCESRTHLRFLVAPIPSGGEVLPSQISLVVDGHTPFPTTNRSDRALFVRSTVLGLPSNPRPPLWITPMKMQSRLCLAEYKLQQHWGCPGNNFRESEFRS